MRMYAQLIKVYTTALIRSIRLVVFVILVLLIFQFRQDPQILKFPLFFFNIFLMIELFFHYHIAKATPSISVSKNKPETMDESFTMQAYYPFVSEKSADDAIKKILKYPQV